MDLGPLKLAARGLAHSFDIASRRVRNERRARKLFAKKDSVGGPRGWRRGWIKGVCVAADMLIGLGLTCSGPRALPDLFTPSSEYEWRLSGRLLGVLGKAAPAFDSALTPGTIRCPMRIPTELTSTGIDGGKGDSVPVSMPARSMMIEGGDACDRSGVWNSCVRSFRCTADVRRASLRELWAQFPLSRFRSRPE